MAQVLIRRYGLEVDDSVRVASELITLFRGANLDVVYGEWIKPEAAEKKDFWTGVAELHDALGDDYTPWRP